MSWVEDKKQPLTIIGVALVAGALVALGVGLTSSQPGTTPAASSTSTPAGPDTTGQVRYELESTDGTAQEAAITIQTPTGSQQQNVDLPMRNKGGGFGLTFTFRPGAFVYISGQNQGSGNITCRITDVTSNRVISENTASGEYSIATCKGSAL